MSRFTEWLTREQPRIGRLVAEDGTAWNRADRGMFEERYDIKNQVINNGAVRISDVQRGLSQGDYFYGLSVPAGRQLVVYYRALKLTDGVFTVDIVVPADGFTGGTVATKSKLNPMGPDTVQTDLYAGVTPAGDLTVVDKDLIDTGSDIGSGTVGGAPSVDETFTIITGESCLRINSEGTDPYSAAIRLIAWEEDVPE